MVLEKILVVSRHTEIQQLAQRVAQQVLVADDAVEAVDIVTNTSVDLIISDGLIQPDELRSVSDTTNNNPPIPIVIIGTSGHNSPIPSWLSGTNHYYLPNVDDLDRLQQIVDSIQQKRGQTPFPHQSTSNGTQVTSDSPRHIESKPGDFFADELASSVLLAGKSRAIQHTLKMIKLVADSNCNPVLITGETGTGKELAARAVHASRHPGEQFVAVNCAALTANLLESELFGHTRGSFTGADKDKIGLLELAARGTIFLDEISEMPMELQAKLLRVLQEKTFRKVGGVTDISCKATIITSSNRDLRREVRDNRFRRDLYYRLNICPINIAPLRDPHRTEDIRLLAEYFLKTSTVSPAKAGRITAFTEMTIEAMEKHIWPGNVRELRNVVERAIILETTDKIGLSSIHIEPLDSDYCPPVGETSLKAGPPEARPRQMAGVPQLNKPGSSGLLSGAETDNPTNENVSNFSLEKAERELIARALQESGWQKTKAATLLGITRATLYAKVKQHNIQRGTYIPKAALVPA